jgi:hypothetical protein
MSENQEPQTNQGSPDPLASLHRMSTTAGVGSQEYVAINLCAVAALLLGLASVLVLLSPTLLVVPAVAIIFGFAAVKQVRGSNGTQTGHALAWLGILVAVGMVAFIGARELRSTMENNAQKRAVEQTVQQLGDALKAGDLKKAYDMFSPAFRERPDVPYQVFADRWKSVLESPLYGKVIDFGTNGRVEASAVQADGSRQATTMLVMSFQQTKEPLRAPIGLRQTEGVWKVESFQKLFPPPPPPREGAPN